MSREHSYFAHNGMPLQALPNAGRVRRAHSDAPWLCTFGAYSTQATEQKARRLTTPAMPETGGESAFADAEAPERQANTPAATVKEVLAAPNLLQRAAAGAGPVNAESSGPSAGVQSVSAVRAGAQPKAASAQVGVSMGIAPHSFPAGPSRPMTLAQPMTEGGAEMRSSGGSRSAMVLPAGGRTLVPETTSPPSSPMPRVMVQKHITIQKEISPLSGDAEAVVIPSSGPAVLPLAETLASPMTTAGAGMMKTGSVFLPGENLAAAEIPDATAARLEAARVEMGAGNTGGGQTQPLVMPQIQSQSERSQQELLDRLNYRPAPQQEGGGRRVHIGNLHITVQRPAMAAALAPPSSPSTQPQVAAATPQTFFNPWERLHTAFD